MVKIHNFGSGTQGVHISCPRGDVETVGDVVQTVVEKVPVLVESHRGGLVAEHSLDEFHVRARGDREARSGVPKLVRVQARHVIDAAAVDDAFRFLVEQLPPQTTVAIATRADPLLPLSRLRSRGELLELRAADLRLSPDEADAFLNQVMGLNLSPDHVTALETRTEGWAAGLQLAALSLRSQEDPAPVRRGIHRKSPVGPRLPRRRGLNNQPDDVRQFLLDTSVLRELSGPLCDALTGRTDGSQTLEELERGNLFGGFFPDLRPIPAAQARIRIAQGRLPDAWDWSREHRVTATDPPSFLTEFIQLTLARLLIAQQTRSSDSCGHVHANTEQGHH